MILKIKSNFYQIFKLIFLLLLTNIPTLYAHNLFNGGCKEHCGQKVQVINNEKKLNNVNDQMDIESKNSCLNKSLCRGWPPEIISTCFMKFYLWWLSKISYLLDNFY